MAVRSIIDVVVNTGAFQRFASLYARYQQTLPAAVALWNSINNRVASTSSSMRTVQASSAATASSWRTIASHTANVASSLKSATDSLLRWTSISTIVGGLLGVGSLFGLDRLALGVGRGRGEAAGVGTTYGQQTAFNLSYGRFVDPGILNRISELSSGPQSWILRRLGASREALTSGNSVDIARQILPSLQKFAKEAPPGQLGLRAHAFQYDKVVSLEELRKLAAFGNELGEQDPKYKARLAAFTRAGTTEKDYQDFSDKLEEAGETIKNTFVIGLQPVIPKLTELSGALTNVLVRFLKEIKPADVELLATKIGEFANYLGGDEFKLKLDKFINGMEELGASLEKWGQRLGLISGPTVIPPWEKNPDAKTPWNTPIPKGRMNSFRQQLRDAPLNDDDPYPRIRDAVKGVIPGFNTRFPPEGYPAAPNQGGITSAVAGQGVNPWNTTRGGNYINNQSGQEMWLTIMSMPGASTPKAAAMVGTQ
jgi:hypothetical protein